MKDRLKSFAAAVTRLRQVLRRPSNQINRDAAIQRFEFCFELAWKCVQHTARKQGLDCQSPRGCLQAAFKNGWLSGEKPWLLALEDRNLTSHTYDQKLALKVYRRLPRHLVAFDELLAQLKRLAG